MTPSGKISQVFPHSLMDFVLYNDSKKCRGNLGIKNLFDLMREEVRDIHKDYRIKLPKRPERLKELLPLLFPFHIYWKEWTESKYCNLTPVEISIIELYRNKQDFDSIATHLNISYETTIAGMANAIRKLKSTETRNLFQKWKDFKHKETIQNVEEFLNLPIETLQQTLPKRIYSILLPLGKSLAEILEKVSVQDLYSYKNFGKQAEIELKEFLQKSNCLHLLKQ